VATLLMQRCHHRRAMDAYSQSASTGPRPWARHPNCDRRGEP
jgi:hypothetical protein